MTIGYYRWDGEALRPLARSVPLTEDFVVGEVYRLEVASERSSASHRHYFAALHQAWLNLPEDVAEHFADEEHLRRWCLIKCGYADQRSIVLDTAADARRVAAAAGKLDPCAVVTAK